MRTALGEQELKTSPSPPQKGFPETLVDGRGTVHGILNGFPLRRVNDVAPAYCIRFAALCALSNFFRRKSRYRSILYSTYSPDRAATSNTASSPSKYSGSRRAPVTGIDSAFAPFTCSRATRNWALLIT